MTEKFLNALRNYIDAVGDKANDDAVTYIKEMDEHNYYSRAVERAWKEVLRANDEDNGRVLYGNN